MKYYCTHCKEPVLLVSMDIEDERYEYCPLCGNDHNLVPFTGQPSQKETSAASIIKPSTKHIDFAEWQAKEFELEKKQDRAIDAYHNALDAGHERQEAEREYKKIMSNVHTK